MENEKLYNAAALLDAGKVQGVTFKQDAWNRIAAAWHSCAVVGQPSAARINTADEAVDDRIERVGLLEVRKMTRAGNHRQL